MRRIIMLVTVALVMAAMIMASALPACADLIARVFPIPTIEGFQTACLESSGQAFKYGEA